MDIVSVIRSAQECAWINPQHVPFDSVRGLCDLIVPDSAIDDAEARLIRFAPFIRSAFPETTAAGGLIESALLDVPSLQRALGAYCGHDIPGRLMLKQDSHLPISGSIKARGGIYEVLKHAEDLALARGMISYEDDYARFDTPEMRTFFSDYSIHVGSTGNLGLSIGVMSAAMGFRAVVHMSHDAKQWKKDLLRSRGVQVIEYTEDYSQAVAQGRRMAEADPASYFVDDEKSVDLFLGYAVAARRLKAHMTERGIAVDHTHPLVVYIPAGVGGAPGGVGYGLKQLYGDDVHLFFCEPVQCPSVLLGVATGLYEKANVRDFDLTGQTAADGLACASPSGFVTRIMTPLLSGAFTVDDARLFEFLHILKDSEDFLIEPSSCASFIGPIRQTALTPDQLAHSTQILWATGGSMVPEEIWAEYLG